MDTTLFMIRERTRPHAAAIASPEHFMLGEGQAIAPQRLLEEPGWSPYCLDDVHRSVLFVHLPPDVALAQSKFVYTAQFEHAQQVLRVPYTELERVAGQMPEPGRLIFIYSMGRCGSTLMSQIFSQIEGVYSLSEPDIYTNLSILRSGGRDEANLMAVLKVCTLLLAHPQQITAFKFRSHGLGLADWLHTAFPDARSLFMYRSAIDWAQSVYRFLQRLGLPNQLDRADALQLWGNLTGAPITYVEPQLDPAAATHYFTDLLAPAWTSYLDRYLAHYERGVPFHAIRYEELNDQRAATLTAALAYCGLPASHLQRALSAFATDSQAGTAIARDVAAADLSPERVEGFMHLLAQHPRFADPDIVLPDSHTL